MNICLNRATAGRDLPLDQFVSLAATSGFAGADVDLAYAEQNSLSALHDLYQSKKMAFGGWGPPVDFRADEAKYLDQFPMTPEQRQAILDRQWNEMLRLGGNIYYTSKLGACDGLSFQQLAAKMTGSTQHEYAQMMINGGRSVEGNRSKSDVKIG